MPVDRAADRAVVEAFLDGTGPAYGPTLHIEGEVLLLSGWWHVAVRLAPDVFILRDEPPREASPVLDEVAAALGRRGLRAVAEHHPLAQPITYARLSLVGVEWNLWGPDLERAERAMGAWADMETAPRDLAPDDFGIIGDWSAEMEGARRTAGLPPSVLLAVGLHPDRIRELQAAVPEFRFEARPLEGFPPDACGDIRPSVVVVDARDRPGREFVMELRAAACGRFLAVAAFTADPEPPLGADVALAAEGPAGEWREALMQFL